MAILKLRLAQRIQCRAPMPLQRGNLVRSHPMPRQVLARAAAQTESDSRTASVQVKLGNAIEQINVQLTNPNSKLVHAEMDFPLGLVLENVNDEVAVVEVAEGGAAARADCQIGDVVRGTTAMTMQMTYPTMNIMFGGVGRPKLVKILLPTSQLPCNKVMDAVRSNSVAEGGDGSIALVLERAVPQNSGSSNKDINGKYSLMDATPANAAAAACDSERELVTVAAAGDALFDPRIFETMD